MLGVGRVEGLFLVCLVSVYRVLVPVEFVVTASAVFFAVLFLKCLASGAWWIQDKLRKLDQKSPVLDRRLLAPASHQNKD